MNGSNGSGEQQYLDALRDLRAHADAFAAESAALQKEAAALAVDDDARRARMTMWQARIRTWRTLFTAYLPAAAGLDRTRSEQLTSYVHALLDWVALFEPEADDI